MLPAQPTGGEQPSTDKRHKSAHPGEPYDNALPGQSDNDTLGRKGYQPSGGAAGAMRTQQKTAAELAAADSAPASEPTVKGEDPDDGNLKAVLVDVDGTLVDSNDGHARAWVHALSTHGHPYSFDTVRPMIGKGGDKVLLELVGLAEDSNEAKAILETRKTAFIRNELPQLRATHGAAELLGALREARLQVIVATSAAAEESGAILRQAKLDHLIDQHATSSDAENSKPDPDIIQAALRKAELLPSQAIMLGDTPYDIVAAMQAGIQCLALRCGGWWNNADLAGAAGIFSNPADLLAQIDRSPIGPAFRVAKPVS